MTLVEEDSSMLMASCDRRCPVSGRSSGRFVTAVAAAFLFCMVGLPARASFQFSDWVTQPASSATVAWTYSAGTATLTGSVPINFNFDNIPALPISNQPATLTITASTNVAGTFLAGPNLITEPLSGSISISNGANLLTIGFVGTITGQQSGGSATVSADVAVPGQLVAFTSDFIAFLNPSGNSFQLTLPSIVAPPGLTLNSSGFITDFTSNVQGSASVSSANALDPIPEPASLVSVCTGLAATGFIMMVRRRRKPL
jgi:hypothetical protein